MWVPVINLNADNMLSVCLLIIIIMLSVFEVQLVLNDGSSSLDVHVHVGSSVHLDDAGL